MEPKLLVGPRGQWNAVNVYAKLVFSLGTSYRLLLLLLFLPGCLLVG